MSEEKALEVRRHAQVRLETAVRGMALAKETLKAAREELKTATYHVEHPKRVAEKRARKSRDKRIEKLTYEKLTIGEVAKRVGLSHGYTGNMMRNVKFKELLSYAKAIAASTPTPQGEKPVTWLNVMHPEC